jgi:hypothetical protein
LKKGFGKENARESMSVRDMMIVISLEREDI